MGDTIVYTVNPRRKETDLYTLRVLTVVSDYDGAGNNSFSDGSDDEVHQEKECDSEPGKDALEQEIASEADTQVPDDLSQTETIGNSTNKPKKLSWQQSFQSNAGASSFQRRRAVPKPSLPEAMMCSVGEGGHAK